MPPEKKDCYAEFCEHRGESHARLNDLEDRMCKVDDNINGLRGDVREQSRKQNRILGGLFVIGIIMAPILTALVTRLFNGGH